MNSGSIQPKSRLSFLDPRRIFFGWWLTIAGGLLCFWGYAFQAYGFSALFKPISEELGFSRTATSVAASITRFEGGLEAPVVGYLADNTNSRWGSLRSDGTNRTRICLFLQSFRLGWSVAAVDSA